ncbi:hypothetical protein EVAR_96475_1 [Eumeta japonica]|uniref:Uncharacterized protein n=1 Tax=Eumeta variegata TaxID=151549 RepID=A0A4C1VYQ8_EUMVA|nr:hypothetical protein EVAR_96475_1 [Eumeta japonica]
MTYASPVFAHAAPKALHRLQVIQNKFCRAATDAHWCVRAILHRDRTPTISKYMKDASKRFLSQDHTNAFVLSRRLTINRRIPPTTVGHGTQVIDLNTLLHPAATNRLRPGGRKEPTVTVSCDIYAETTPSASSIAHVTRRHSHVPSGRTGGNYQSRRTCHPTRLDR